MRNLESMIGEFVDGLLLAIGEATIEDLRELLAQTDAGTPLYAPNAPNAPNAPKSEPAEAPPAAPARTGRLARLDHGAALRRSIEASLSSASEGIAEITDPESLLSLGGPNGGSSSLYETFRQAPSARPAPPPPISVALLEPTSRSNGHAEAEIDSPASGVRPRWTGSTVRLSDNETLARVSNSGVVIRRKKKA